MNVTIRAAQPSDLALLIDLSRRTIRASYRSILGDESVEAFVGSGMADQYVKENLGQCSVLVRDGAVVGYSVCKDNLIDLMMIDGTVHRQGLGTRLLQHVEAALFQRFAELKLESFAANDQANAFYRKNGWGDVKRYLDPDSGVDKILFHKTAAPR